MELLGGSLIWVYIVYNIGYLRILGDDRAENKAETKVKISQLVVRFALDLNIIYHNSRTIRVSNSLDPDQDRRYVGPDLGPNCLQRLSAVDKSCG